MDWMGLATALPTDCAAFDTADPARPAADAALDKTVRLKSLTADESRGFPTIFFNISTLTPPETRSFTSMPRSFAKAGRLMDGVDTPGLRRFRVAAWEDR